MIQRQKRVVKDKQHKSLQMSAVCICMGKGQLIELTKDYID